MNDIFYEALKDSNKNVYAQLQLDARCKLHFHRAYEFAYAYAITCHKAQGSEWNQVLVFEEWFPNVAEEHKRWLYTAATRASEKLVIIKK